MEIEIVTKQDLCAFRIHLINDIKQLLQSCSAKTEKQWLKNSDVKELLKISSNSIQRLRISGKLKSSKVGGIHYYRYEDIESLLNSGFKKKPNA